MNKTKIYFASDLHLGAPSKEKSLVRERKFVRWLDVIKEDAKEVYLLGDIFDFWFEYKHVVPKGYVRLLAKLLELQELGIPITIMRGNHDMWLYDYLEKEIGLTILDQCIYREWNGKKFYIGHGDALGPGDTQYKILKKIFQNKFCQCLFRWLHPDIGMGIANAWSQRSRSSHDEEDEKYLGDDKEWLFIYCKEQLEVKHHDYFVFGHRHLPIDVDLGKQSRYVNLGDWIQYFTYACFDGENLQLLKFEN